MEHDFEWNEETRELTEVRTGNELVDSQNNKVEGKFVNKTIYPESTARQIIKEFERQIRESKQQEAVTLKAIENLKKDMKPVDKAFFAKWKACAAHTQIDQKEMVLKNNEEQRSSVAEQLGRIKEVMGEDF